MKERILRLLDSTDSADRDIAKILLVDYFWRDIYPIVESFVFPDPIKNTNYICYGIVGVNKIKQAWGIAEADGVDLFLVFNPQDFSKIKNKYKMRYQKTQHRNIYRQGNMYRVRKMVKGTALTATFPTVKECKEWLTLFK